LILFYTQDIIILFVMCNYKNKFILITFANATWKLLDAQF